MLMRGNDNTERPWGTRAVLLTMMTALAVSLGTLVVAPARAADIPSIPRPKLNMHGLTISGAYNSANGYCTITGNVKAAWYKAPKGKGTTNGHYLMVKSEIIVPAGYGGSLVKSIAKKKYVGKTHYIPHQGLPMTASFPVSVNLQSGSGDYGVRVTVRVVRAVSLGLDTTAWKSVYKTPFKSGFCNTGGISVMSPFVP